MTWTATAYPITIQATTDRREAFRNARYIINCVRIGGLPAFEMDVDILVKIRRGSVRGGYPVYGRYHVWAACDRGNAEFLPEDIREVAEPGSDYAESFRNPNAMATWGCQESMAR